MSPAAALRTLAVVVSLGLGGCAWRTADVEHHLGPVLFRYRAPDASAGGVGHLVRVGPLLEAGEQWGASLGFTERITMAPAIAGSPAAPPAAWLTPWSPLPPPSPGRWNLSLLYLQVRAAPASLIVRRMVGGEVTVGSDANAASVGWTSRTLVRWPEDAVSVVRFDSHRPLAGVFVTWPEAVMDAVAASKAFEEVRP